MYLLDGWIKLYRSIQDHWLWLSEPFTRGQAFIDLLMMANHKDKKIMFNGELIEVKVGTKITSLRQLGDRWSWSSKKVKKFLEQLQKDNMITFVSDNKKTLVTIENYSFYQSGGNTEETQKKHQGNAEEIQKKCRGISEENQKKNKGKSEENQRKTNKNDKEYIKNDKEYIKNDKEWEEGEEYKEKAPPLPPLSFPTNTHKKFYEQWGENSYRMWFMDALVSEGDEIIVKVSDYLKQQTINTAYKEILKMLTGKNIIVEEL